MALITHTFTNQVTAAGVLLSSQGSVTASLSKAIAIAVGPGAGYTETDIVLKSNGGTPANNILSLVMSATGADTIVVHTNSSGSPGDALTIPIGGLVEWAASLGIGTNPFPTADVTKLYLQSTAGAIFTLAALVSPTNG